MFRPRRLRELTLFVIVVATVLALGWLIARDLRQFAGEARQLQERQTRALNVIDELNFQTQEVRRILLYALHTSDANHQLAYAEGSRSLDARVKQLIDSAALSRQAADTQVHVDALREAWRRYLNVRDEVIGYILEGSLPEGVQLDQQEGTARFNEVRHALTALRQSFAAEAAMQIVSARVRADRARQRLMIVIVSVLLLAAAGMYLINRGAALERLLRIEAQKGSILQAVPNPIISTDARGCIVEFNEAAERTFGCTRAEAIGARIADLILTPGARGALAGLSAPPDLAWVVWPRLETTGVRHDGTEFPMEVAAVTHTIGRERVSTVHVSDLTERHRNEEELRRAREAAESADRAKGEFLATMSHELRTPLVGVIGVTDLLQTIELPRTQRHLVRMLRSSASALLSLVSDILDYSRVEAGLIDLQPEAFALHACIEEAIDPVAELAVRKNIDVGYAIAQDVPLRVVADRDRVRQVLLNLLSNAVKFTDSGEVAVRVTAEPRDDGRRSIVITVQDTGCGVPDHLREKLFQRFSPIDQRSLTGPHKGAGLGLAISERLSRLLGGSLTATSQYGHGSTFRFVFRADVPADAPVDAMTDSLEGLRVRPVLGCGIVREQVLSFLRRWGAVVCSADSPERAAVIVVDADAMEDGVVMPSETQTRLRPTLVLISRLQPVGSPQLPPGDRLIAKPVRAAALYEALCAATSLADPIERPAEGPSPAAPPSDRTLAILLVEDNEANRRVVQLMLEELGVQVDEAADGLAAVECARQRRYDLILMDVRMPGLDGLEATRRIRAEHKHAPAPVIIGLTANVMSGDEAKCRAAGMDGYLPKPIRLETLARTLDSLKARA